MSYIIFRDQVTAGQQGYSPKTSSHYSTPIFVNEQTEITRLDFFFNDDMGISYTGIVLGEMTYMGCGVYITDQATNENIYKQWYGVVNNESGIWEQYENNSPIKINNASGIDTYSGENSWRTRWITFPSTRVFVISYQLWDNTAMAHNMQALFYVTINRRALKPYSVADVITRAFDLIEPLGYGKKPRFRLLGAIYSASTGRVQNYISGLTGGKLNNILAPEFSFTKETLREQLQQVGGFIHAEPRIVGKNNDGSYTVDFDFYGKNEYSNIKDRYKITTAIGSDINEYHTGLDSSVDNLVNTVDKFQGVAIEPFGGDGAISLRSESVFTRITDDNDTVIPTSFPIYMVPQTGGLIVKRIPTSGSAANPSYSTPPSGTTWDITPYLFEATKYGTELSSYDEVYPFSKSYAVYYTQGKKNIKGLFFKVAEATGYVLKEYAILNILKVVTGNNNLTIPADCYPLIEFQINYYPLHSERIKTHKAYTIGGLPRTLAYNQAANGVETSYFGEHLKGISARLGNIEKSETFLLAWLSDIPKIGKKYDKDYYIASVACEYYPTYIKCTVGLSKDFNRLSNYIGINSQKRMWEVSERQISRREVVAKSYYVATVVDDVINAENAAALAVDNGVYGKVSPTLRGDESTYLARQAFCALFFNRTTRNKNITSVLSFYETDESTNTQTPIAQVTKPVIVTAIGNSLVFTVQMEDNYSAGQKAEYTSRTGTKSLWGQEVPYVNYYGRAAQVGVSFLNPKTPETPPYQNGKSYPEFTANENFNGEIFYAEHFIEKDSREALQLSYSWEVISADKRIIIGSALAKNSYLANKNAEIWSSTPSGFKFYVYDKELNVMDKKPPSAANAQEITLYSSNFGNNHILLPNPTGSEYNNIKSWAIVSNATQKNMDITNPDGTDGTYTYIEGGEILIAGNFKPAGQVINFTRTDSAENFYPMFDYDDEDEVFY